jgi:hypothetical protein
LFWKEPNTADDTDSNIEAINKARTKKLKSHVHVLIKTPMSIPLLSESGVGKALKKFIKECKRNASNLSPWFPDVSSVHDTSLPAYRGKTLLAQMELILSNWKVLATASGAKACHGRHRNTSEDQHLEDLKTIRTCVEWRQLFDALAQREQIIVKERGAKMRKIRDDLQTDRHQVQSTKTKLMGNRKLGNRLLYGDSGNKFQSSDTTAGGKSKLGQLRQATVAHGARVAGKSGVKPATSAFGRSVAAPFSGTAKRGTCGGFGSSVATPFGQRRSTKGSNASKRHFYVGDGKKITLPKKKRKR